MLTTLWFKDETIAEKHSRFEDWYNRYEEFEGEPFTITVHHTWKQYGGPEEGGWWYRCGNPVETICIFSRAQAIQELIRLHEKYDAEEYEEEEYDISLAKDYATWYPEQRPHYE